MREFVGVKSPLELQGELTAPGSELAFIVDAREKFEAGS
jgi:hypothetical protein